MKGKKGDTKAMGTANPKLVIIDGHSVLYRSFYAIRLLTTKDGTPTNAVYGFANTIIKILDEIRPTHMLVTFDSGKNTFRSQMYDGYKANRREAAPEIKTQFPLAEKLVEAFGIRMWKEEGYESDDLIGTITKNLESVPNIEILVVTGDRDLFQIVSDKTTIVYMKKGISEVEMYSLGTVVSKYGVQPVQLIDVKSLMGDSSDNIPGIAGIGEKTALKLISDYGSLDGVYANIDSIKGKLKERLENGKDDAFLSKVLATIKRDVPTGLNLDDLKYEGIREELAELFDKLEFKSLIKRLKLNKSAQTTPDINVTCIDETNIGSLISSLDYVKSIQVEALGENPHRAHLLGIAFHTNTTSYFLPYEVAKKVPDAWKNIAQWMADSEHKKYVHDLNRARVVLGKKRVQLDGVVFDTHMAAYLCNPVHGTVGLHSIADEYGASSVAPDEYVYKDGIPNDVNTVAIHAASKARTVKELVPILSKHIAENMLAHLFDVEMKLAEVLVKCETAGIRLDADGLRAYGEEILKKTDELEHTIYSMAGKQFNIGSTKQLASVLFEDLGLPAVKKTKTGYSTDVEVLEELRDKHPIVENILEYRKLSGLYSKFVEGLVNEIHKDGKIHTYYNMALTSTGRLSSQYPNMQNIPIRTEEGRYIRKFFLPSEGYDYILTADYSQIELRILAHMSQDPRMQEAFVRDMDIHTKTAMDVFGVSEDEVNSMMRRQAKAVNFGIVYGISDHGLAKSLRIPKKEAREFIDRYFSVYQGVKKYMDSVVEEAKEKGYVSTILNRRRYIPDLRSSNFNVRKAAERIAMNTPIQGSAADIIKLAMISIHDKFKQSGLRSRMLLQVHDELVFEVVENELEQVQNIVRHEMENAVKLSVPLRVDIGYGKTWYDAK